MSKTEDRLRVEFEVVQVGDYGTQKDFKKAALLTNNDVGGDVVLKLLGLQKVRYQIGCSIIMRL
jgi:hypothetical protein